MAIVYFDSSAFVKLVVEGKGSDLAAARWDGCDAAVSSRLAYPEVRAALARSGARPSVGPDARRQAEVAWQRALRRMTDPRADGRPPKRCWLHPRTVAPQED